MSDSHESLIEQMTLEEKVSLLAGADLWHTVPLPRLGIPQLKMTDGPNGARGAGESMGPSSASFPVGVAMAATWNPQLVEEIGQALGAETRAKGAHLLLGPTVNLHRSPLAGRNFECYSEDPYLTARMATAYIRGLQSTGVGACIKHFVCNDSEFERMSISSKVGERPLRELYLRPFEIALAQSQPWALMTAYNKLNGVYCSENARLLHDILKNEWGFDGLVISDWTGTYSPRVAAGGLDLEMPGPGRWMNQRVAEQVRSGQLDEAEVDDKVRRLLRLLERTGVFEQPELQPERAEDRPEHRALARRAATEAIVLLKNEGDLLPLQAGKVRSIAVIGQNAAQPVIMGGGSSQVTPHYVIAPLDAIREQAGPEVDVLYSTGAPLQRSIPPLKPDWLTAPSGAVGKLQVTFFDNLELSGEPAAQVETSHTHIAWTPNFVQAADSQNFSARLQATFTAPENGRYTFGLQANGLYRLRLGETTLIDAWSDLEHSNQNFWTAPERSAEIELQAGQALPLEIEYSWSGDEPWRRLYLGCTPPQPQDPQAEAVMLAARCDLAIVYAGLTPEWETEGFDRQDMDLVCGQNELIARVAAANANTIVVLNVGSPVRMPWLESVPAVLQVWYGGQESGNAAADVLFGQAEPGGRLPTTFPKRLEDNPAYLNYPGENGQVLYGEGLYIGYRYYDKKDIEPLFPFGYGLSYTSFQLSNLRLSPEQPTANDEIEVQVDVTNTGERAGCEVVQLYLHDEQASLERPEKELRGFAKICLQPGETQTASFRLGRDDLAFYDDARSAWVTEAGQFRLLVGRSARDLPLQASFDWPGDVNEPTQPQTLSIDLTIGQLLDDPRSQAILEAHLPGVAHAPEIEMARQMTLEQVAPFVPAMLTPEVLEAIRQDLDEVE